jgi:hypothetical protein
MAERVRYRPLGAPLGVGAAENAFLGEYAVNTAQRRFVAGAGPPAGGPGARDRPFLTGEVSLTRIWALRRALAAGHYDVVARLPVVVEALLGELRHDRAFLKTGA